MASVFDSATGLTTKYYYDFTGRNGATELRNGADLVFRVSATYDEHNQVTSQTRQYASGSYTDTYTYNDNHTLQGMVMGNIRGIGYDYDGMQRIVAMNTGDINNTEDPNAFAPNGRQFTYRNSTVDNSLESGVTTNQITKIHYHELVAKRGYPSFDFDYTYDDNGNILTYTSPVETIHYEYDSQNQLTSADNTGGGMDFSYTYDAGGNIDYRKEYAYTTAATPGNLRKTVDYSYDNSTGWKDRLVSYNGKTITYESTASGKISGNILSDGTWTYNWQKGRQLASMTSGSTTWSFTYNADGLRTKRTNGSSTYSYIYNGDKLSQMTVGNNTLNFAYDASGTPLTVTYNNTVYYYVTNIQGDVIAILNSSGSPVVTYTYDAWGKVLSTSGSMASTLGSHNPLRYRSYVYDQESGLYYLQSRYYDPNIGRFINADALITTGQGLLGNNMFAYCNNNPVLYSDRYGTIPYNDSWLEESFRETGRLMYEFFIGRTHPDRQTDEINNSIIEEQNKLVGNSIRSSWDTYQSSYIRNQESELRLAQSNVSVKTNSVRNEEAQTLVSVKTNSVRNEEAQT